MILPDLSISFLCNHLSNVCLLKQIILQAARKEIEDLLFTFPRNICSRYKTSLEKVE